MKVLGDAQKWKYSSKYIWSIKFTNLPSIVESFKIPDDPNPSWLLDDDSNDELEDDPDIALEACKESDEGGGRIEMSPPPDPIEAAFPSSKYEVSFWLFKDALK